MNKKILYPYPSDITIQDFFKEEFNKQFICFMPFFKLDYDALKSNKERQNSYRESWGYMKKWEDLKYPYNFEILRYGHEFTWAEMMTFIQCKSLSRFYALMLESVGAIQQAVLKDWFVNNELNKYLLEKEIYHPASGYFGVQSLSLIYNFLLSNSLFEVIVQEEFDSNLREVDLSKISEHQFIESYKFQSEKYIYSKNSEILFTIDWDSFFYVICTRKDELMDRITLDKRFVGFLCDEHTSHHWWCKEI